MPKISIVTPCYNAEKYITKTIESLCASTFTDWEHVVVDDGSSDNSAEIVLNYAKKEPRLRLIQQPNGGVCNARNNGFKACSLESEYLLFLDQDDYVEPQMLEIMVKYLDKHPDVGLAYCDHWLIDIEDKIIESPSFPRFYPDSKGFKEVPYETPETPVFSIAVGACLESCCVLRKSIYVKTSGWPEWLGQGREGNDLFLHMALLSNAHFVPRKLYKYRQHTTQAHKSIDDQAQIDKLIARWKEGKGLTPEQKGKVAEVLEYIPAFEKFLYSRDELYLSA